MTDPWNELLALIMRHRGKLLGALIGVIVGWMIVSYGFIKSLFVLICLVVGYVLGSRVDRDGGSGHRPW